MELADFEFKKERKLGEFVQDFINLLKLVFGHMTTVLLRMLVFPICGMLLLSYYISTKIDSNFSIESEDFLYLIVIAFIVLVLIGLLAFGFTIEYFILLRNRKNTSFGVKDVWFAFRTNIVKYFKFFLGAIFVGILLIIPTAIAVFFSMFIPLVGSFVIGIVFSILGLYFFVAFMLYREGYSDLIACYGGGFSLIKNKIFDYGIASYIVSFIFQSLLYLITALPAIIIAIVAYNYVGFSNQFFDTTFGKALVSAGGTLMALFAIIYYMLAVVSYGIIYETAKELKYGESVFDKISNLGRSEDE